MQATGTGNEYTNDSGQINQNIRWLRISPPSPAGTPAHAKRANQIRKKEKTNRHRAMNLFFNSFDGVGGWKIRTEDCRATKMKQEAGGGVPSGRAAWCGSAAGGGARWRRACGGPSPWPWWARPPPAGVCNLDSRVWEVVGSVAFLGVILAGYPRARGCGWMAMGPWPGQCRSCQHEPPLHTKRICVTNPWTFLFLSYSEKNGFSALFIFAICNTLSLRIYSTEIFHLLFFSGKWKFSYSFSCGI
jgi:hypothetical protein